MFKESQEIQDDAWDCTLIKSAKENKDLTVNAIYEWTDEDVWDFIKDRNIEVNPLYSQGFRRVGCALCPLSTPEEKKRVIQMYPTYMKAYINAAQKMLESDAYKRKENVRWKNGKEVFDWWVELDKNDIDGQMSFDDLDHNI